MTAKELYLFMTQVDADNIRRALNENPDDYTARCALSDMAREQGHDWLADDIMLARVYRALHGRAHILSNDGTWYVGTTIFDLCNDAYFPS